MKSLMPSYSGEARTAEGGPLLNWINTLLCVILWGNAKKGFRRVCKGL